MAKTVIQDPVTARAEQPKQKPQVDDNPLTAQAIRATYANGIKNAKAYRLKQIALTNPEVAELLKTK